jgi:hypothetical protein
MAKGINDGRQGGGNAVHAINRMNRINADRLGKIFEPAIVHPSKSCAKPAEALCLPDRKRIGVSGRLQHRLQKVLTRADG